MAQCEARFDCCQWVRIPPRRLEHSSGRERRSHTARLFLSLTPLLAVQQVNYFLHSGHLQIEGLKMSKSLKNFVTVREALETYSARQIRFLFLLPRYHEPMEYSANAMSAVDLEASLPSPRLLHLHLHLLLHLHLHLHHNTSTTSPPPHHLHHITSTTSPPPHHLHHIT